MTSSPLSSSSAISAAEIRGEGAGRVRKAYPGRTWDRLAAIKARYDPTNLFRLNHNVPPRAIGDEFSRAGRSEATKADARRRSHRRGQEAAWDSQ